ncbi:MAG: glycosyltransferase family 2 protein [Phycisphaerales bacterium]
MPRPPTRMSAPDLTVVYTTKDSMRTIERSIRAVRSIARRVIVVDSGSGDGTIECCEDLGCEVVHRPWHGHEESGSLAIQKQHGLDLADSTAWVLLLDSDEIPTPELVDAIADAVRENDPSIDGYLLNRRHWYKGGWISAEHPDRVLRLVRRGRARMQDRLIHELLECRGRTARLPGLLRHESWIDFDDALAKSIRYAHASALMPESRTSPAKLLINAPWSFFKTYFLHGGCFDGWRGLEVSVALAARSLVKHLLIRERDAALRQSIAIPVLPRTSTAAPARTIVEPTPLRTTHAGALHAEPAGSSRAG